MSETVRSHDVAAATYDRRSAERLSFSAEQDAAIHARAPLVTVSAGAGSGKTRVLVERFIDLVQRDRVTPLEILAITFTEKAAAEMKQRIVRRFEEREDVANRRQAEAAYISTIHGFCSRVLRENPLVARLDPSFAIMDELTRNVFLDEQLELLYRDDWFAEYSEVLKGKRFDSERPLLFELIEEAAFLPGEFGTLGTTEAGFSLEQHVEAAMSRLRERWESARQQLLEIGDLIDSVVIKGPKTSQQHAAMRAIIATLRVSPDPDRGLASSFLESTGFTAGLRSQEGAERIRGAFKTLKPTFEAFAEVGLADIERLERERFAPLKLGIYARAARLRTAYEDFKRHHGFLDFVDMQQRALEVLGDRDVREGYARRFKHILLDEAQDTNDVQMQIIDCLRDGRQSLFAVGDVKQAIYGFRGANVEIFQRLARTTTPDARLSLVDNYRSRAGIIEVVNAAGERLWHDRSIVFEPLVPKFPYENHGADPRTDLWLIEESQVEDDEGELRDETAEEVREREGIALAAWIRAAVEGDEALTIHDTDSRSYRRVRYGDIAILSGTRTPFPAYERALADLGIPFVKDGGREFFRGREVVDLLAALRVIENPLDDVSLLAALRSPLFGWGDRDLVRLRVAAPKGGALWDGMPGFVPEEPTADGSAYATIVRLRRRASLVPPTSLIEMICDATAYRAALLSLPRGRAQVANIDQLLEFARATAKLDGPSLSSFVHRASLAEKYLGTQREAPLNVAGSDAVVISTVHGAKGLEWPVVFLAGLDGSLVRANAASRYSAPDGALIIGYKDDDGKPIRSAGNAAIVDAAKEREEAEARRLLYVAMTRARERLILSSRYDYPKLKLDPDLATPIKWLATQLGIDAPQAAPHAAHLGESTLLVHHRSRDQINRLSDAAASLFDARLTAARAAVRAGRRAEWDEPNADGIRAVEAAVSRALALDAPAWSRQQSLAVMTVTRLVYFFRCPLVYYFGLVLQIDEHPRGRGKAKTVAARRTSALERGTRVHELLERADLSAEPVAEARRLASGLSEASPDEVALTEEMLRRVLVDPLMDRARSARRIEREYPFYLDVAGTTVQGVIDLVFEDHDGRGVVVDYKSNDLAASGRIETLSAFYRPQIELYALAAREGGLVDPNEATLYFLNKSQAVTTPVDSRRLEVVETQAAEALSRIAQSRWDTEPGEKCRACGYRKRGYCEVGKRFKE